MRMESLGDVRAAAGEGVTLSCQVFSSDEDVMVGSVLVHVLVRSSCVRGVGVRESHTHIDICACYLGKRLVNR